MATISLDGATPDKVNADAVVIGVFEAEDGPQLADGAAAIDRAFDGRLTETLAALDVTGKQDQLRRVPTLGATTAPVVVAVGLGPDTELTDETLRRAAGRATRTLAGTSRVAIALPRDGDGSVRAIAEGALLGAYAFGAYRSNSQPPVDEVVISAGRSTAKDRTAIERAAAVAAAVHRARDLANTPARDLTPAAFARIAEQEATDLGLSVEVLDEKALRKGGYGGISGVGQGSANPPRLVRIGYEPSAGTRKHLALVGKGITFDSGGLSLKTPTGMEWMKVDMSGAAAVFTSLLAIGQLQPRIRVTGWLPLAENMPSGTAIRPGDVLSMYAGKTVEVRNTDAEGRLILADALARASEEEPDVVIDVATLTGAALTALGTRIAGLMANDDDLREQIHRAATRAGEATWPMPLPSELRKPLESDVADIANTASDHSGGMLRAGVFLRDFIPEGQRWAHLDIAGPAYNSGEPYGYTPKGATGAAVRTFVQLALDMAAGARGQNRSRG